MSLQDTIAATIKRHAMLGRGRRIGVAVSGGADSVFLLHALREADLAACVLHVNHRLRGSESDADEAFVANLAAAHELPLFVDRPQLPEGNLEQEARRARYRFFTDRIAAGVCAAVATGHTLDDQAETVLSRFLRGAGTAGLAGIRPVTQAGIIRPLLDIRRAEIRHWLTERAIVWREDSSNRNTDFLRNRLRQDVLPGLLKINPSLPDVLASTAEWAAAEEVWWGAEVDRFATTILRPARETVLCEAGAITGLPIAVQRRLLRRAVELVKGSLRGIDFRHIEAIRLLAASPEGTGRIQLPALDIYRSFDWLRLAPPGIDSRLERDFETQLCAPGITIVADRLLTIEMELVIPPAVYNVGMDVVDRERAGDSLTLRNWRPGDSYTPAGRSGATKIKTLFQETRIPLWERRRWPVIARGNQIVWTRRFGVAEEFSAGPHSAQGFVIRERTSESGESNVPMRTSTKVSGTFHRASTELDARRPGEPNAEVL